MSQATTIELDIAKTVFHAHGADERGAMVFSRKLSRVKLLGVFVRQPECLVAMDVYSGGQQYTETVSWLRAAGWLRSRPGS